MNARQFGGALPGSWGLRVTAVVLRREENAGGLNGQAITRRKLVTMDAARYSGHAARLLFSFPSE